ncbi:MAG: hypothetical protein HC836_20790 [Richelia sp. RM2_1_2]|nr:hypothetical protein [Richelia sp. SM2_1_7]NJO28034.1 hypothetical protein [Richelia sp. SL_2_1]NJO60611.1 hypothetical protein [Richelia sp. RM2_1_2]
MSITNPQIAIAGRVVEGETKKIIAGAMVKIIEMPEVFQTKLSLKAMQYGSQWQKMFERPDCKITASDGYFYFINLPTGEYVLETSLSANSTYSKVKTKVKVSDSINGKIPTTIIDDIIFSLTKVNAVISHRDEPNR